MAQVDVNLKNELGSSNSFYESRQFKFFGVKLLNRTEIISSYG